MAEQSPSGVAELIIENNPLGFAQNMKRYTGQTVDPNDVGGMIDVMVIELSKSAQPGKLLYDLLNVPVNDEYLNPVQVDWVLDKAATNQTNTKSMILPDPALTDEEIDYIQNNVETQSTTTGNSINWGSVIASSIPGILGAFGLTQGTNSGAGGNSATPPPQSTTNWTPIIIIAIVLLIVGIVLYKATRS